MQKRAQLTKENILSAAIMHFAKTGYAGTRIDDIALSANANKQRIYAYFTNKEKLFRQCIATCFQRMQSSDEKAINAAEKNPKNLLAVLTKHYAAFHTTHPECWRLLAWANLEGIDLKDVLNSIKSKLIERLEKLCQNAHKQGQLAADCDARTLLLMASALSLFPHAHAASLQHSLNCTPSESIPKIINSLSFFSHK